MNTHIVRPEDPSFKGKCIGGPIHGLPLVHPCSVALIAAVGDKIGIISAKGAANPRDGRTGRYFFNFDHHQPSWLWRGWY